MRKQEKIRAIQFGLFPLPFRIQQLPREIDHNVIPLLVLEAGRGQASSLRLFPFTLANSFVVAVTAPTPVVT
jgi:hypothetical protein